jgi:hypothetical protein
MSCDVSANHCSVAVERAIFAQVLTQRRLNDGVNITNNKQKIEFCVPNPLKKPATKVTQRNYARFSPENINPKNIPLLLINSVISHTWSDFY